MRQLSRSRRAILAAAILLAFPALPASAAHPRRPHPSPAPLDTIQEPADASGQRDPRYGGFSYNEQGYGMYTRGPDGGFGGYPPGSDGALELQNNQRYRCQAAPSNC